MSATRERNRQPMSDIGPDSLSAGKLCVTTLRPDGRVIVLSSCVTLTNWIKVALAPRLPSGMLLSFGRTPLL